MKDGPMTVPSLQATTTAPGESASAPADRTRRWFVALAIGLAVALAGVAGWMKWAHLASPSPGPQRPTPAVAVAVASVERGDMIVHRRYPGEVFADAVEITTRVAGHLAEIGVRLGDPVNEGDVLARIDDAIITRQIRESQARIAAQRSVVSSSEIAQRAARRQRTRAADLVPRGVIAEQEVDDLETATKQRGAEAQTARARLAEERARLAILRGDRDDAVVRAPFAGVVARRDVDPGAFVAVGAPILRIVAQTPLHVRFRVPESELAGIRPGLPFVVSTASLVAATGHVTRLSGEVSADRTLEVEGTLDLPAGARPGMYVDLELHVENLEGVRIVSDAALLERIDAEGHASVGVFTHTDERAQWIDVRVLGREGPRVAIEPVPGATLPIGAPVLVRGHRELSHGTRIRVVDEGERT